jgi:pumilio RNA-binding family
VPADLASLLSSEELDICKQVEVLAFDQGGCRMIQKKLEETSADSSRANNFAEALVHVMHDILPDVMTNQFGNYLCQKLIEAAPVNAIKQLVHSCLYSLVEVSMDLHGTRAIQTLIEVLGNEPQALH